MPLNQGRPSSAVRVVFLVLLTAVPAACARVPMELEPAEPPCVAAPGAAAVRWVAPLDARQRTTLRAWCLPVGDVARYAPVAGEAARVGRPLVLVSWNMAVGAGRLADLVRDLRATHPGADLVLLIQEAYRSSGVPSACPAGSAMAGRLGPRRDAASADILQLADRLSLHAAYVPSMRNGSDCARPHEDRGNAILSTLPLTGVVAIELPFAQQRRVAVAAAVGEGARALRVISVHFDTLRGHRRQAQALWDAVRALGWDDRIAVGGDFNAHPFSGGVAEMRKEFVEADCGDLATHVRGLRLDRIFTRGIAGAIECRTEPERFGSDHRPLVANVATDAAR